MRRIGFQITNYNYTCDAVNKFVLSLLASHYSGFPSRIVVRKVEASGTNVEGQAEFQIGC